MTIRAISYAKLQRRHGGKFIARKNGKILASGATYPQLLQVIRKRHLNRSTLTVGYAPPKKAICIYSAKLEQYISIDPHVCHGKLCFKGTRIMVYIVLEMLKAGETPERILKSYPTLTIQAIRAVRRNLIEDRTDARTLQRAIRTSRGTISHDKLLDLITVEARRHEPGRPLRQHLAERSGRRAKRVAHLEQ